MRALAVLGLVAGCGRLAFDPRTSDGLPDATSGPDAANVTCPSGFGPWSVPVESSALTSSGQDWDAALHPDGDLLVFSRYDAGAELCDDPR